MFSLHYAAAEVSHLADPPLEGSSTPCAGCSANARRTACRSFCKLPARRRLQSAVADRLLRSGRRGGSARPHPPRPEGLARCLARAPLPTGCDAVVHNPAWVEARLAKNPSGSMSKSSGWRYRATCRLMPSPIFRACRQRESLTPSRSCHPLSRMSCACWRFRRLASSDAWIMKTR